ncbi:hypothetical protein LBMAG42_35460 [Deltaproteobacteria bacterium]|nr:hypothetical protein LBMAG42_35460 [Deltaproteobacteria bacterium]
MTRFGLVVVASTRGGCELPWSFSSFGPYVPAMSEAGEVAFQATFTDGRSGAFVVGARSAPRAVISGEGQLAAVVSHPDLNASGDLCFYGETVSGARALFLFPAGGAAPCEAAAPRPGWGVGSAGPTMNEGGEVAFRTERIGQRAGGGVGVAQGEGAREVYATLEGEVHGLPLMGEDGSIVFRHDEPDGSHVISVCGPQGRLDSVVRSGGRFVSLGRFPACLASGGVCFTGTKRGGGDGVFYCLDGRLEEVVDAGVTFESIRGALVDGVGRVVFYATPRGGTLGIYRGMHPTNDRILGLGDALLGSVVVDLALNPVSINQAGQFAIRVALADGQEAILRVNGR